MRCPACGQENPEGFRFCGSCGTVLDAATSQAREERKIVTVLFADLVGFTARAESMDPEDVRRLLAPYHAGLRQELERFGGTVEKFIGDAVMALFGAPAAHEDDPERAVRAAIAIRDWAQDQAEPLEVRIAVNTGEALVALGARPEEGEGMASGDVVNTAARLQSAAPVNGILVGETTYRATRHVIDYREAAPVAAKGKAEPVPVWEALTPRAQIGVDVVQSARGPLVGRNRELALLVDTVHRVRDSREPQLVTLVGVPGIGKSRLTFELLQVLTADPDVSTWRQGRCLPYGDGVTFWPLGEIVKSHAEIFESDSPMRAREKLQRMLAGLFDDPAQALDVEQQLRQLVGAGTETNRGIDDLKAAFAAWRAFFEALANDVPLVLVIEDLQWGDDAMLDFVDYLIDWANDVSILLIATSRPELFERRPGWGGGKANATTLSLAPLSDAETAGLLNTLLARPVIHAETQEVLLERAGGNPLYAEQFAQMYLERGDAGELRPPETIQGLIAARLDALRPDEKELLHEAAIHGKVFWGGAVAAADGADAILHALERKEFIRRQRRSAVAGETEYAFRHMLVRDVAYAQIPRAVRAEKHARAAEWIEALADNRDDHVELRANHYADALDFAAAAAAPIPDLEARAALAFREAGERAFTLGAHALSGRHFGRALELMNETAPERAEVLLGLGKALVEQELGGVAELEEASAALRAKGELTKAAEAETYLADGILWLKGQTDRALEHVNRAAELVRDEPESPEKLDVALHAAFAALLLCDYGAAAETAAETVPIAERLGDPIRLARATVIRGHCRLELGDPDGLEDLEHAVTLGRTLRPVHAANTLGNVGIVLLDFGALDRASALFREAEAAARDAGDAAELAYISTLRGRDLYYRGEWDRAFRIFEKRIAGASAADFSALGLRPRTMIALISVARGDAPRALEDAERALELGRSAREAQALHTALAVHAHVASHIGDAEAGRASAREFLGLISEEGTQQLSLSAAVLVEPVIAFGLEAEFERALRAVRTQTPWKDAAIALVAGDAAVAAQMSGEIGSRPDEARAHLVAARSGAPDAARHLQDALSFYRAVGAAYYVRALEELLAATA
jgi:class 3 adenylate cyclase/tetratricopeptide (TPR) repeat protein